MAWYKKYKTAFQSRLKKQYVVYILDRNAPIGGKVLNLTPAANPFVTEEKYTSDIFTPLRSQTGYLRILDEIGGTLLEELMPYNNTEKMVELWEVKGSGEELRWRGFLAAKAYSQPWDGHKHVLEFPLNSILSVMEDIQIDAAMSSVEGRMSLAIVNAVNSICGDRGFEYLTVIDDMATAAPWATLLCGYSIFFSDETIVNEGETRTVKEGVSYADAMKELLNIFGLVMREKDGTLYIAHYDTNGYNLIKHTIGWNDFADIANGGGNVNNFSNDGSLLDADLLSTFSFRAKNNTAEYIQGYNTAKVVVSINTNVTSMVAVPIASETADALRQIAIGGDIDIWNGGGVQNSEEILYVQFHDARNDNAEFFAWYMYNVSKYPAWTSEIYRFYRYSNAQSISANSFVRNGIMVNPSSNIILGGRLVSGCLPCRFFEGSNTSSVNLQSGIYLGLKSYRHNITSSAISEDGIRQIYRTPLSLQSITSPTNAYLVLDIKAYNIYRPEENYGGITVMGNWLFGIENSTIERLTILASIRYGNYAWDGDSQTWVNCTDIASAPGFGVAFDSGGIITNKPSNVNVNKDGGYFIPVPSGGLIGQVQLAIWDIALVTGAENTNAVYDNRWLCDARAMIVQDITLGYYPIGAMTASDRETNTYRKDILSSGFNGTKTINTKLGTTNNNAPSPTFLKSSPTVYVESMNYSKDNSSIGERPEMHLLNRVTTYYNQVRRAFKGSVVSGAELFAKRYTYLGRYFFGVDKKHDWRNDEQEVKFIEVT